MEADGVTTWTDPTATLHVGMYIQKNAGGAATNNYMLAARSADTNPGYIIIETIEF
jgi:hypothetical protein